MKANRVRWIAVALMAIGGIALTFTFRHNHSITTMIVTPRGAPIAGPALQFKHTVPAFGTVTNASRQVDACGLENVRLEVLRESTKDAAKRWMAALLESGDPRAKAVGLLMQAYTFGEDPVVVPVEGQNRTPLEQPRDELAELAVVTDDPAVYAMAIRVCRSKVDAFPRGPCRQLSLSAWAQSDAGNAVPWLLLAGEAQAHKDPAAEVSALDRAIESHTLNSYGTSLYAFAQSSMVKDVSPAQQYFLGTELLGYEAAWPESQYTAALKYCSAVAIQNAGVRQRCDALAELIASAATTIVDLSVAEGIGERLGWPSDKTSSMKEEIRGLAQALPADGGDSWSCDRVRIGNGYLLSAQHWESWERREMRAVPSPKLRPVIAKPAASCYAISVIGSSWRERYRTTVTLLILTRTCRSWWVSTDPTCSACWVCRVTAVTMSHCRIQA